MDEDPPKHSKGAKTTMKTLLAQTLLFLRSRFTKSEHVQPRQGTEICNFGELSHWIFGFFLQSVPPISRAARLLALGIAFGSKPPSKQQVGALEKALQGL